VNVGNDVSSPFAQAAHEGHQAIVDLLIERGADVETRDELGMPKGSALIFLAAVHGEKGMAEYLMKKLKPIRS